MATLGHRRDIDLRSTDLRHADLSNGNLANAQLSDSDLRNTYLYNANLKTPPEPCRPTGRQSSQFVGSGASIFLAAASGGQGPDPREFAETEASSAGTRGPKLPLPVVDPWVRGELAGPASRSAWRSCLAESA
ncbi:pentapeptide repeat-containing protein [Streptomyces sp. XY332]|uniref:pentapeptide repeat-containing protein n=1 Tax=Streptomyces sp. XY332 TaxID=1415561 RepID=UPI00131C4F5B